MEEKKLKCRLAEQQKGKKVFKTKKQRSKKTKAQKPKKQKRKSTENKRRQKHRGGEKAQDLGTAKQTQHSEVIKEAGPGLGSEEVQLSVTCCNHFN